MDTNFEQMHDRVEQLEQELNRLRSILDLAEHEITSETRVR